MLVAAIFSYKTRYVLAENWVLLSGIVHPTPPLSLNLSGHVINSLAFFKSYDKLVMTLSFVGGGRGQARRDIDASHCLYLYTQDPSGNYVRLSAASMQPTCMHDGCPQAAKCSSNPPRANSVTVCVECLTPAGRTSSPDAS